MGTKWELADGMTCGKGVSFGEGGLGGKGRSGEIGERIRV